MEYYKSISFLNVFFVIRFGDYDTQQTLQSTLIHVIRFLFVLFVRLFVGLFQCSGKKTCKKTYSRFGLLESLGFFFLLKSIAIPLQSAE